MLEYRGLFPTITETSLEDDVKPYHPRSTHSTMSKLILLVSISIFRAFDPFAFVMESAELLRP